MTKTVIECENCSKRSQSMPNFCPKCGSKDPWISVNNYEFEEDDLPFVYTTSLTDDNWEMWDDFCESYFGVKMEASDVAGLSEGFPLMKYRYVELYWILTEDYNIKGPFNRKDKVREVISQKD